MPELHTNHDTERSLNTPVALFTVIDDSTCILHSKGTYTQVELYTRGPHVYARKGSSFLRLLSRGTTSIPSIKWVEMDGAAVELKLDGYNIVVK